MGSGEPALGGLEEPPGCALSLATGSRCRPEAAGTPRGGTRAVSRSRAEHAKENGLPYQSPGIVNGIKLSPQDPRPSSPAALQMTGERGSEKVRAGPASWRVRAGCPAWLLGEAL